MKTIKYFEGWKQAGEKAEDFIDAGCNALSDFLKQNPNYNNGDFLDFVTWNNKADRDSRELQDISNAEILRLAKIYKQTGQLEADDKILEIKEDIINNIKKSTKEADLEDFGNSIGKIIAKYISTKTGFELDSFINGIEKGVSKENLKK